MSRRIGPWTRSRRTRVIFHRVVLRTWWRLPKPRARRVWASWAADDWNRRQDAVWDAEWRAQARGEPSNMLLLPVGDLVEKTAPPTQAAPPARLSGRARARRALADRVFEDIRQTPAKFPYRGGEVLMATALPTSLEEAPGALAALEGVPEVIANAGPGEVLMRSGPGGLVLRVHGPTWSVVVRLTPYVRPVLVFVDNVARFGWQVDDDPEAAGPIQSMLADTMTSLQRFNLTDPAIPAHG